MSLAYTQRLQDADLLTSTGSPGDSYDNTMAESNNGLYKAEVIHSQSGHYFFLRFAQCGIIDVVWALSAGLFIGYLLRWFIGLLAMRMRQRH
ncbi:hypothetical protein ACRPQY_03945 [Serratia marcescens]|uniref:hypothetical protein n=1 Tax=Serratia marcescens TaxID=615 RepID=UPI003D2E9A29